MKLSCKVVTSYKLPVASCKICCLSPAACRLSGQSMIEVVVGIGVATLLSIALISTTIYTQKMSRSAKNNTQATKLAQESIEKVRILRDRGSGGFSYLPNTGCGILDSSNADPSAWTVSTITCPSSPVTSTPSGTQSVTLDLMTYYRWIAFAGPTASKKTVVVNVAWQEGASWRTVINTTYLSNTCTGAIGPNASPSLCP